MFARMATFQVDDLGLIDGEVEATRNSARELLWPVVISP